MAEKTAADYLAEAEKELLPPTGPDGQPAQYLTDVTPDNLTADIEAAANLAPLERGISKEERRRREAARQLYFYTRGVYPKTKTELATPVPFPGVPRSWGERYTTEAADKPEQTSGVVNAVGAGIARGMAGPAGETEPGFTDALRGSLAGGLAGWSQMFSGTPQEYQKEVPSPTLWERLRSASDLANPIAAMNAATRTLPSPAADLSVPPNYAAVSAGTPADPVGNIRARMPALAGISDNVILQAVGLVPPSQEPIEASLVGTVRRAIEKGAPEWTNLGARFGQYREDHPVRSFAGGALPFLVVGSRTPGALLANGAERLGPKVAGAVRLAVVPAEAAALTPGDGSERATSAAYATALGLGLNAAGKALKPAARAAAKRAGLITDPPPITSPESKAAFAKSMAETSAQVNRMKAAMANDPEVAAVAEGAAAYADELATQTQRGIDAHRAESGGLMDVPDAVLDEVVGGSSAGLRASGRKPLPTEPSAVLDYVTSNSTSVIVDHNGKVWSGIDHGAAYNNALNNGGNVPEPDQLGVISGWRIRSGPLKGTVFMARDLEGHTPGVAWAEAVKKASGLTPLPDSALDDVVGGARSSGKPAPPPSTPIGAAIVSAVHGHGSAGVANRTWNDVKTFARGLLRDRFAHMTALDEEVGNAFNEAAAAGTYGRTLAHLWDKMVTGGLDEREKDLFERYLFHQRAVGKKQELARTGGNPSSVTLPELTPVELAEVQGSANIQESIRRHQEIWQQVEGIRDALNPTRAKAETPDDVFINMLYDRDLHGPGVRVVQGTSSLSRGVAVGKGAHNQRAKLSGNPDFYVQDYGLLLSNAIESDYKTFAKRDLVNTLKDRGLAVRITPKTAAPPQDPWIDPSGREHGWVRVQVRPARWAKPPGGGDAIAIPPEEYWMPGPLRGGTDGFANKFKPAMSVATAWESLNTREQAWASREQQLRPLFALMDARTGLQLFSPVEAVRHFLREVSILSKKPGVDEGLTRRIAEGLVPWVGPRMGRIYDMVNITNHPDADAFTQWAGRVGAWSDRAVQSHDAAGAWGKARHFGGRFLFEFPEMGKRGIMGIDLRTRLVAAKLFWTHLQKNGLVPANADVREFAAGGNKTYDREFREFLNGFGNLTAEVQTDAVNMLRKTRANPFAAMQSGMRPAEVRALFGGHGLPTRDVHPAVRAELRAETLWRGTIGTALFVSIMSQIVNGKWPWEIADSGKMQDLVIGKDKVTGQKVYTDLNLLDPDTSRASRTVGLRQMLDAKFGAKFSDRFNRATSTGIWNEFVGFVAGGPPLQAASILATGRTPYMNENGEWMQVAVPQFGGTDKLMSRAKASVVTANPNVEAMLDGVLEEMGQEPWMVSHGSPKDPRWKGAFFAGRMVLGRWASTGPTQASDRAAYYRSVRSNMDDVLNYAANEIRRASSQEEKTIILNRTLAKFPKGMRGEAAINLQKMMVGRTRGEIIGGVKSDMYRYMMEQE